MKGHCLILGLVATIAWIEPAQAIADALEIPPGIIEHDRFGTAIAIDGDTLLVSAPHALNGSGSHRGRVFEFQRESNGRWQLTGELPYSGSSGQCFGQSLDLSGDLAIVGAWGCGGDQGAAQIFRRETQAWMPVRLLTPVPQAVDATHFGIAVAIDAEHEVAVVGSPFESPLGDSIYIFDKETSDKWNAGARIASDSIGDGFGWSVDVEHHLVAAGAPWSKGVGAVEVFAYTGTWLSFGSLVPDGGRTPGELFGWAISIDDPTLSIAVGRPHADGASANATGAVELFKFDGSSWIQTAHVDAAGEAGDNFGYDVALTHKLLAIGAPGFDGIGSPHGNGAEFGEMHLFARTDSQLEPLMQVAGENIFGRLGTTLALSHDDVAFGAPLSSSNEDDALGDERGSAFICSATPERAFHDGFED